jgi:ABC-type multidrug transport system ATPase subunit
MLTDSILVILGEPMNDLDPHDINEASALSRRLADEP